jgi:hypothetical protein
MSGKFKVLYYVNQFFGQVGGEDKAGMPPEYRPEKVGPALGFEGALQGEGEIVGTIICGDNYFNENKEKSLEFLLNTIREVSPDLVAAGPAFNAGRYGVACAELAKAVVEELKIPVVTGMYVENPGVDVCKDKAIVVSTADSAAGMRKALPAMAAIAVKLVKGIESQCSVVEDMTGTTLCCHPPDGIIHNNCAGENIHTIIKEKWCQGCTGTNQYNKSPFAQLQEPRECFVDHRHPCYENNILTRQEILTCRIREIPRLRVAL